MAGDKDGLWGALAHGVDNLATEEDYEHGYAREVRGDLAQYVSFRVGRETYALPISQIAEISKIMVTTPVPRTADFVVGIANVRGAVLPVVDLTRRLRLGACEVSRATRVLIVIEEDERYGLMVDRVDGVVPIAPEDLEDAPGIIAGPRGEFIRAIARHEGELLIVLDLSLLLEDAAFAAPPHEPAPEWRR